MSRFETKLNVFFVNVVEKNLWLWHLRPMMEMRWRTRGTQPLLLATWPWVKIQTIPPVNIRFNPTSKIGSLKWVVNSPKPNQNGINQSGFDHHSHMDSLGHVTFLPLLGSPVGLQTQRHPRLRRVNALFASAPRVRRGLTSFRVATPCLISLRETKRKTRSFGKLGAPEITHRGKASCRSVFSCSEDKTRRR